MESMLYEVDAYGIKATLVEQGHLRSSDDEASGGGGKKARAFRVKEGVKSVYTETHSPAMHAQRMVRWLVDQQPASTARSAELSWQLAHCRYPPLRLLLGSFAVESVRDRLRCIIEEVSSMSVAVICLTNSCRLRTGNISTFQSMTTILVRVVGTKLIA